jgi:hypothetical protein
MKGILIRPVYISNSKIFQLIGWVLETLVPIKFGYTKTIIHCGKRSITGHYHEENSKEIIV